MNIARDYSFGFQPNKCQSCGGKCCRGESGYVFVSIDEINDIARYLELSFESFCLQYVRKVGYRFSLIEKVCKDGLACIFFDEISSKCSIYTKRPKQCRSFPFWEAHKNLDESAFILLQKECPGVYDKGEKK